MKYRITVQLPRQERTPSEELLERAVLLLEAGDRELRFPVTLKGGGL